MSSERIVRVTDLARGGAGVSREEDGRVLFIPYTAPGDLVRVQITEEHKNYAQAELLEVLEPSPQRIAPRCPVFGKCGGCQWQHLPYSLQWATKVKGVVHALARVQVKAPEVLEEIPAERIWEYRNRVQLRGETGQLGFRRSGSNELVAIDRCDIAHPLINSTFEETRQMSRTYSRPYKVEIEVTETSEIHRYWNSRHAAGGFRQVHDEQNEKLRQWVSARVGSQFSVLYDLFGGSGNLSLSLKGKIPEIHCVDTGAPRQGGSEEGYFYHRMPVGEWLSKRVAQIEKKTASAAILDPPRIGLGPDFTDLASQIEKCGVTKVIAVGCDPDAWARDVSRWIKRGWRFEEMMIVDLFPQTPHTESVGVLSL